MPEDAGSSKASVNPDTLESIDEERPRPPRMEPGVPFMCECMEGNVKSRKSKGVHCVDEKFCSMSGMYILCN